MMATAAAIVAKWAISGLSLNCKKSTDGSFFRRDRSRSASGNIKISGFGSTQAQDKEQISVQPLGRFLHSRYPQRPPYNP